MIETERLLLRRFQADDAEGLCRYLGDPEVVRYEPYAPLTLDQCRAEAERRATDPSFWAVCLRDGTLIGNLYLAERECEGRELGYVFARSTWGHGYATEAARGLLDTVFAGGAHRVYAMCNPENSASWRLLERIGMRREAHLVRNVYFEANPVPKWQDTYIYAMLAEEWRKGNC